MKRKIVLKNQEVEFDFRRRKGNRNIRLSINSSGEIALSAPWWVSSRRAEKMLFEKSDWVLEKLENFKKRQSDSLFRPIKKEEYQKIKKAAEKLAREKLEKFNAFYGFHYGKVSIRNQKSRWGSCSEKGNLNFNCRIVYIPDHWIDYLVVHELCHLKEFNHSKNFWNLVAKTIPDWKEIKKAMRRVD